MNSLRARMALTLVISIVCVVGLSTFLISYVMGEIGKRKFADGVIDRVMMIAPILEVHDQRAQLNLAAAPGPGDILQEQTSLLKEAFRQAGIGYDIVMKQPTGGGRATVSVNLGPGWLTAPVPDRGPPRRVWYAVLIWMAVITVGIVAIALAVSHRITRQLSFLQSMAT
ncbi:MAG: hypothetical protein ABWY64_24915, partial [Tardiphaga sp.]